MRLYLHFFSHEKGKSIDNQNVYQYFEGFGRYSSRKYTKFKSKFLIEINCSIS